MASRRLTITFCLESSTAPLASVVVTIIGSISGVKPTATDNANSDASSQSPFVNPLISNTTGVNTSLKGSQRSYSGGHTLGQCAKIGIAASGNHQRRG